MVETAVKQSGTPASKSISERLGALGRRREPGVQGLRRVEEVRQGPGLGRGPAVDRLLRRRRQREGFRWVRVHGLSQAVAGLREGVAGGHFCCPFLLCERGEPTKCAN